MDKLYIPYGVKIENEIISDFGRKEMKHFVVGLVLSAVFALLIYFITGNPLAVIACGAVGAAGSFQASKRGAYSQSVVDIVISMISFYRSQQNFEYVYKMIGK